jgi:hypothetical protein
MDCILRRKSLDGGGWVRFGHHYQVEISPAYSLFFFSNNMILLDYTYMESV